MAAVGVTVDESVSERFFVAALLRMTTGFSTEQDHGEFDRRQMTTLGKR